MLEGSIVREKGEKRKEKEKRGKRRGDQGEACLHLVSFIQGEIYVVSYCI